MRLALRILLSVLLDSSTVWESLFTLLYIAGLWKILVEIAHAFAGFAEFRDTIYEKGDIFAELVFDFFEGKVGILYGIMKHAGNDSILIHIPFLEDFHNSEWVNNIGLASFAKLTFVRLGGDFDCFL